MMKVFAALLSGVVLAGSVVSRPFPPDGAPGCRKGPEGREFFVRLKEELALTEEQQEQLMTISVELKRAEIEKKAELAISHLDLVEMLGEIQVNRSQIEAKVEEIGGIRTEMELTRIDALLKARNVLTSDQFETFKRLGFSVMKLLPPERARRFHR